MNLHRRAGRAVGFGVLMELLMMVLGIFIGSLLWWLLLCTVIGFIRKTTSSGAMIWINRGSGIVLVSFGLLSIAGLF